MWFQIILRPKKITKIYEDPKFTKIVTFNNCCLPNKAPKILFYSFFNLSNVMAKHFMILQAVNNKSGLLWNDKDEAHQLPIVKIFGDQRAKKTFCTKINTQTRSN